MKQDNFSSPDYYDFESLLSQEQLLIRDTVRDWVKAKISPIIDSCAQESRFPVDLIKEMAHVGAFGAFIPEEFQALGLDYMSYGLIMQELERGDSGIRSAASVQSSLVMYPIWKFGDVHQQKRYLPHLANGDMVGCFGLTEPNHGSDPGSLETRFVSCDDDHIILNGSKMWISNASIADLAIVWAKDVNDRIHGVIVERGMQGFSTAEIKGKWSLRASVTGSLHFDNVRVPKKNILPNKSGLGAPLLCLDSARFGIAWGAIGAAMDCYEVALNYAKERFQFGRPIAGMQLQQKKLAEMITEITKAQLLTWRLGVLKDEGKATSVQISMAKRNNVEMALNVAREARQVLGAMGIVGDYPIMRHQMNLESVITYEGTHDIHLLITGMDITGVSAFK